MNTVTRKIQINLDEKENRADHYKDIYRWQKICVKSANMISTAHYVQDGIKDLFYLEDGTKKKLANIEKDEDGILTMSSMNTTYQLLSKKFKGDCPMAMLSGLNNIVQKTFKAENIDVQQGKKSLRTYRDNIPMPVPSAQLRNINQEEDGNFTFVIFGKRFKTFFGRDLSGNRLMFERGVKGDYKICDSSLQIKNKKMFLLTVFQFESEKPKLEENKELEVFLSVVNPIEYEIKGKRYNIGTKEEFLHRRLQIQKTLRNMQINAKYSKGGKGRIKKMKSIERFNELEKNYVKTKMHLYSRHLVNACVNLGCGKIILVDQLEKESIAKENESTILRNWSYYGLKEFIEYKAKREGITVIVR